MIKNGNLGSKDLQSIMACVIPTIIGHFMHCKFPFTSTDVDEVVSMTLVKLAKNLHKYDESCSKKAWFQKIARCCTSDYMTNETKWRCHHTAIEIKLKDGEYYESEYSDIEDSESYEAEKVLNSKENVKQLKAALDSIGGVAGKALWLKAVGYETEEIEDRLGKFGGALRTAMSRGRDQLRNDKEVINLIDEFLSRPYNKVA
jgi:DNA-directed RNA polymerase specialized sigma24 family protein